MSPRAAAQRELLQAAHHGPAAVAQRRALQAIFGDAARIGPQTTPGPAAASAHGGVVQLVIPHATLQAWAATPAPNWITPGNILFATVSGGAVGSIYFTQGRIRLIHQDGPIVEHHPAVERFVMNDADVNRLWDYFDNKVATRRRSMTRMYRYAMRRRSILPGVVGNAGILVEFFGVHGAGGWHPSRGGPAAFPYPLVQADLNVLHAAAASRQNATLTDARAGWAPLQAIPIH